MRLIAISATALAALAFLPQSASAQGYSRSTDPSVLVGQRAPWNTPYEYDSGSDNDRRPELPYYQQGRGQQTGGPSRNLLPYDGFTITPR